MINGSWLMVNDWFKIEGGNKHSNMKIKQS